MGPIYTKKKMESFEHWSGVKSKPIRLFIGWDDREAIGGHVFIQSLRKTTKHPVSLTLLTKELAESFGVGTDGTNPFSLSRFLVPYLCNYQGYAIYMDGADMMLRSDLKELWDLREPLQVGAQVVKHDYQTKSVRKYIGTVMETGNEGYPRKNWSSVIIWDCGCFHNRRLTPEFIASKGGEYLHRFTWLGDAQLGELPAEWNHIPRENPPNPNAKLVHFSLGLPGFEHYRHDEHSREWQEHLKSAARGLQFLGR